MRRSIFALAYAIMVICLAGSGNESDAAANTAALRSGFALQPPPESHYTVFYRFKGAPDGANPGGGLLSENGLLYGTTAVGGSGNDGTVYQITKTGAENVLYRFGGGSDGRDSSAGLVWLNGAFYGTTSYGGDADDGTVFTVTPSGQERVIYSFHGKSDGANPTAPLIAVNGKLYGTTAAGAGSDECYGYQCGTVFEMTTSGKKTTLHRFLGYRDGANPNAGGLVYTNGALYGSTQYGGFPGDCPENSDGFVLGCGVVYAINISTGPGVTFPERERVIYRFTGGADDGFPTGLTLLDGLLYGMTEGYSTPGTVFSLTTDGREHVLYTFKPTDGYDPFPTTALIALNGMLYGTTSYGGAKLAGTIFSMTTSGRKTVLHTFQGGNDGSRPEAPLFAVGSELYGTTYDGGGNGCVDNFGCGTIFKVSI